MWWGLPVKLITTLWSTFSHKTSTLTMFWYWWLLYTNLHSPSFLSSFHRPKHFSQIFTKKLEFWLRYSEPGYFAVWLDLKFPPTPAHCCPLKYHLFFIFWDDSYFDRTYPAGGIVTTSILTFLPRVEQAVSWNVLESIWLIV